MLGKAVGKLRAAYLAIATEYQVQYDNNNQGTRYWENFLTTTFYSIIDDNNQGTRYWENFLTTTFYSIIDDNNQGTRYWENFLTTTFYSIPGSKAIFYGHSIWGI